jgi:hypothetical protein
MPEPEGGGGAGAMLGRKVGPLPIWSWVMIAGGVGMVIYRMKKGSTAATTGASGSSSPGQGTAFQTTQSATQTDPATGALQTTSYSAQGDGYLPGMLSYAAGPMPYQQGDVYVNQTVSGLSTPQPTGSPSAPGQLQNVKPFTFPGTTNITWVLGSGTTTDVKVTATPTDPKYGGPRSEVVDVRGMKAGESGGHMFIIDQVSRGGMFNYTLTPSNNGSDGAATNIQVKNLS